MEWETLDILNDVEHLMGDLTAGGLSTVELLLLFWVLFFFLTRMVFRYMKSLEIN